MAHNEPIRRSAHGSAAPAAEIPDKLYFRIGEVARLCEVPTYVLRFWESEFPQLKPNKGGTGQRLYRRRDVEMALRVKALLKEEGYTIPGARQVLKAEFRLKEPELALVPNSPDSARLRGLRGELEALLAILSRPIGVAPARRQRLQPILSIRAQRRAARESGAPGDAEAPPDSPDADSEPR